MNERDDFSIEYLKEMVSYNMPASHFHDHYEIYYQVSGERNYFINDQVYKIETGELVLINPHDLHQTTSSETPTYSRILVNFKKSFLDGFLRSIDDINLFYCFENHVNVIVPRLNQKAYVENLFWGLLDADKRREEGYLTRLRLYLIELLIYAAKNAKDTPAKDTGQSNVYTIVSLAVKYINDNFAQELTLRSLSEQFNLSYFYFSRIFREITQFTFTEYISHVRVRQSLKLLKDTRFSVTDIAGMVGFESSTNFERVFKRIMHLSPLKYRKLEHH